MTRPKGAQELFDFTTHLVRELTDVGHDASVTIEVERDVCKDWWSVGIDAPPSVAALLTGQGGRTRTALEHVLDGAARALGTRCGLTVGDGAPEPPASAPHGPVTRGCEAFVLSIVGALFARRQATFTCLASGEERGRQVLVLDGPVEMRGGLIGTAGSTISAIETLTRAYARAHRMEPPIVRVRREDGGDGMRRHKMAMDSTDVMLRGRAVVR